VPFPHLTCTHVPLPLRLSLSLSHAHTYTCCLLTNGNLATAGVIIELKREDELAERVFKVLDEEGTATDHGLKKLDVREESLTSGGVCG
jgi:hypothetical protein